MRTRKQKTITAPFDALCIHAGDKVSLYAFFRAVSVRLSALQHENDEQLDRLEYYQREVDDLLDQLEDKQREVEDLQREVDKLRYDIGEFYRPINPYRYNGVSERDF